MIKRPTQFRRPLVHSIKRLSGSIASFFNSPPNNLFQNLNNLSGIFIGLASFILAIYVLGTKQDIKDMDQLLKNTLTQNIKQDSLLLSEHILLSKQDSLISKLEEIVEQNQNINRETGSILDVNSKTLSETNKQSNLMWELDKPNFQLSKAELLSPDSVGLNKFEYWFRVKVTNIGKRPAFESKLTMDVFKIVDTIKHLTPIGESLRVPNPPRDLYSLDPITFMIEFEEAEYRAKLPKTVFVLKGKYIDKLYNKQVDVFEIFYSENFSMFPQRIDGHDYRDFIQSELKYLKQKKNSGFDVPVISQKKY